MSKHGFDDSGFIYVLHAFDDIYKIGKAQHLDSRIYQLQIQLPYKVELVFSDCTHDLGAVEAGIHKHLSGCRINGEWFRLSPDDLQYVRDAVMYGYHIPAGARTA